MDLAVELGVRAERVNTIRDWPAAAKIGARGELEVPIARTYPLDQVQDAFRELEQGHTHGKIVLHP